MALSYLLRATGPVTLTDGSRLTGDNAVDFLLSDVYERLQDPLQQNAYFAGAAMAVFTKLVSGSGDAGEVVDLSWQVHHHPVVAAPRQLQQRLQMLQVDVLGQAQVAGAAAQTVDLVGPKGAWLMRQLQPPTNEMIGTPEPGQLVAIYEELDEAHRPTLTARAMASCPP